MVHFSPEDQHCVLLILLPGGSRVEDCLDLVAPPEPSLTGDQADLGITLMNQRGKFIGSEQTEEGETVSWGDVGSVRLR